MFFCSIMLYSPSTGICMQSRYQFLNKQKYKQIRVLLTCMSFPCTELAVSSFSASMPVSDQLSWSRTDVTPPRGTNTHQHRCQGPLTWAKNQLGSNPGSCAAIRRSYKSNDKAFTKKRLWLLSIRCPLLPGQLINSSQRLQVFPMCLDNL